MSFLSVQLKKVWPVLFLLMALGVMPVDAAIVLEGQASGNNVSLPEDGTPGALTIVRPAAARPGMAVIVSIAARPSQMTWTVPSGWTELSIAAEQTGGGSSTDPGGMTMKTFYRIVGVGEPNSYTWTFANTIGIAPPYCNSPNPPTYSNCSAGGSAVGGLLLYSGLDTSTSPLDATPTSRLNASSLTHRTNAVTTATDNAVVVSMISYLSGGAFANPTCNPAVTPSPTITEALDIRAPASANAVGTTLQMSYFTKPTPGVTCATQSVASGDADTGVGHLLALKASLRDLVTTVVRSGPLTPGSGASYTLTVNNAGSLSEPGPLTIVNTLPSGLSYVSSSGSGWTCSPAGQVVTCQKTGALAAGAAATPLVINVDVAAGASGVKTYSATGSGTGGDGNTNNDTDTDTFVISTPAYAEYRMDETAWGSIVDSSGNGRNATVLGTAAPTPTMPATPGSAIPGTLGTCGAGSIPTGTGTNGINTGIDVNSLGNAGTISFWYASKENWIGTSRILFDASNELGDGNADKHFYLAKDNNGRLIFALEDNADLNSTATSPSYNFSTDTWHHIAVTWDLAADRINIYLDGDTVPVATSTTNVSGTLGNMATLYFGAQRYASILGTTTGYTNNTSNAYIDEVRLYASALDPLEIADIYTRTHSCGGVSIATPGAVTEGNSGTSTLNFTVSLDAVKASNITVSYATSNGTATGGAACGAGIDYVTTSGTLTIPAGSLTGTIPVTICGDTTYEPNETLTMTLSNPSGVASGSPMLATGTINNDDVQPTISIAATASVTEGNSGSTSMTFTVTASVAAGQDMTVSYATSNGTATGGGSCGGSTDYIAASGTLTIPAGATSATITVPVCGDTTDETDETFSITLSSPSIGTLGTGVGTGTIVNDDVPLYCFSDTFTGSNGTAPSSDWKTTSSNGSFGQPVIMGNRLRLTDATTTVATAAHLQRKFPGAGNKIIIEFDDYAYGGTGADGIAFTMSDASVSPSAGGYGGSLGYAQRTGVSGFAGGWLGIALDEWGNFANPTEGRSGGSGFVSDAVTVRGSGSGTTGYNYHATSGSLSPGIDASSGSGSITYVASGAQAAANSGNVTPALPSHQAGDLLICLVASRDNVAHSVSGWTEYYSLTNSTDLRGSMYYKIAASAAETAPTVAHSGGAGIQAICSGFRGVDTSNPFVVAYGASNTSGDDKINTPSINAAGVSNVLVLIAGHVQRRVSADSNPNNGLSINPQNLAFSQAYFSDYNTTGNVNESTLTLFSATQATGGTLGAFAIDTDNNRNSIGVVMALRPSVGSASGYRYRITVDHTDGTHAYTTVERDTTGTGNSYSTVIPSYDAKAQAGQAAVPTNWLLSFTGSTGSETNIHEIDNLSVCAVQPIQSLGPDHYVISHSGTGLTCEAEPITFTAHAAAHTRTDAGGKTLSISTSSSSGTWVAAADGCTQICYNSTGTAATCAGTLTATSGNNGQASYAFASGETGVRLCLRHNATGTIGINVTDGSATETSGTAPAEASPGADPSLVFSDTGFRFYADNNVDTLGPLVAGLRSDTTLAGYQPTPQTIVVRALKSSETTPPRCVSLLGSTAKTVQFGYQCLDPSSCHASSAGLEINGTAVAGSGAVPTPASNVSVTFNGSGSGTINLKYWDVGQIKLYARASVPDATTGSSASIVTGASNSFLVKPYSFVVRACAGSTPCTTDNSSATDGSGTVFTKAGTAFNATVTAVAYGGTVTTPSFGLGTGNATENVLFARTLEAPLPGEPGSLGGTTSLARSAFTNGVASVTDLTWSEVGVMTLTASNSTFQTVAAAATGPSGYIGRFTPHHFGVTGSVVTRSDIQTTETQATPFTYMGEPMRLTLPVTAYSLSEGPTKNYRGVFARLDAATLGTTLSKWTCTSGSQCMGLAATSGSNLTGRLGIDTTSTNSTTPVNTTTAPGATSGWSDGTSYFKLNVVFSRNAIPDGPYATLKFGARPLDSDGVTIPPRLAIDTTHCVNLDISNSAENATCDPGATADNLRRKVFETQQRFGRVSMSNAFGSELLILPITAQLQYWNGTGWRQNADDSLTAITPAAVVLANPTRNLSLLPVAETAASFLWPSARSGNLGLRLSAPGGTNNGSVDVTLTVPAWLAFDWNGDGVNDNNPSARATFGVNKNNFIFLRENY